jgi:hypothetical protein
MPRIRISTHAAHVRIHGAQQLFVGVLRLPALAGGRSVNFVNFAPMSNVDIQESSAHGQMSETSVSPLFRVYFVNFARTSPEHCRLSRS